MITRRRRPPAQVNIVPLVDVLIVLIFFFLITMQFRNRTTLNISLPEIETAGQNKELGQVEIAIDAEGNFFFNGTPVTREQLETAVALTSQNVTDNRVLIMGDEESNLKQTATAMDICRKYGLDKIRLQAR